jgi:phasin family protein
MATKTASKASAGRKTTGAAKQAKASSEGGSTRPSGLGAGAMPFTMPDPAQFAKFKEMMTPEQAFELYRQNARLALEIIDAAVESTAKMRRLQFEGEEEARHMQRRAARRAAEAENPQELMAEGQNVGQEAMQKAMQYWSEMFDLVVEMQKRLFHVIDEQMQDVPGVKQAKAAMSMMPDLTQTKNLVNAMQGVLSSGGSAFESMQKVMGDFTKMAQQSMPGMKR